MIGELVDLTVVQLVRADQLRRGEQPPAAVAKATVGGERGMLREPAGDRRGGDAMAVAGRDFFCGRFKRVAAIVQRQRFQDFRQRICFVPNRPRTYREAATACAAAKDGNILMLFLTRSFLDETFAVAMRTAIRWFDL